VNTNWVGPKLSRIKQKRAGLVHNFPGSNKNELDKSKPMQDRRKNDVVSPTLNTDGCKANQVSPKLRKMEAKRMLL
jgi:hypothetical protein